MLTASTTPDANQTFTVRVPLPSSSSGAVYRARASGPALVMGSVLDGEPASLLATQALRVLHAEFDGESSRFARFELPLPGEYFLEVTRLFRDFDTARPSSYCVHPNDLRTPVFLGTIYVPASTVAARPETVRSLWVATANTPSFAVTRIQTCNGNRPTRSNSNSSSRSRKWLVRESTPSVPEWQSPLLAYSWVDDLGQRPARRKPPDVPGLCLVGGSHAGHLCQEFSTCRQIAARFPELDLATSREVNYEVYQYRRGSHHTTSSVLDECKTFVLHFGQWDLGYPRGYPTALRDFEDRLRGSVAWVRARYPTRPVYLLPTSYVPLNCLTTACPAFDWRTPPMVAAYSRIITSTCQTLGVGCIDTEDLQGPLWDASPDWNHPHKVALAAMAARIALRIQRAAPRPGMVRSGGTGQAIIDGKS
jgi:hypothetical protein